MVVAAHYIRETCDDHIHEDLVVSVFLKHLIPVKNQHRN